MTTFSAGRGGLIRRKTVAALGATPVFNSSAAGVASATLAAFTVTCTTTVNPGDFLLIHALVRSTPNDTTCSMVTSGWTAFAGNPYGSPARQFLFWKLAVGDEDSAVISMTCSGDTSGAGRYTRIYRFTAANGFNATPIEAITTSTGSGTDISMPTVTPLAGNRRAVCLIAQNTNSTIGSATGMSGGTWTEAAAEFTSSSGSNGMIQVQTADLSGGGAISGGTAVASLSAAWSAVGFALVPGTI